MTTEMEGAETGFEQYNIPQNPELQGAAPIAMEAWRHYFVSLEQGSTPKSYKEDPSLFQQLNSEAEQLFESGAQRRGETFNLPEKEQCQTLVEKSYENTIEELRQLGLSEEFIQNDLPLVIARSNILFVESDTSSSLKVKDDLSQEITPDNRDSIFEISISSGTLGGIASIIRNKYQEKYGLSNEEVLQIASDFLVSHEMFHAVQKAWFIKHSALETKISKLNGQQYLVREGETFPSHILHRQLSTPFYGLEGNDETIDINIENEREAEGFGVLVAKSAYRRLRPESIRAEEFYEDLINFRDDSRPATREIRSHIQKHMQNYSYTTITYGLIERLRASYPSLYKTRLYFSLANVPGYAHPHREAFVQALIQEINNTQESSE